MRFRSKKNIQKQTAIDGLTLLLILSIVFVFLNVILTVNGLSPFQMLGK